MGYGAGRDLGVDCRASATAARDRLRASQFRLVQLNDLRLSCRQPTAWNRWERLVQTINADLPDIAVCTGNVTADAVDYEDDLAYAAAQLRRLRCPVVTLPGICDIGRPGAALPGAAERFADRRARYLEHLGADWWCRRLGDWQLIGLDTLLFGSDLDAELDQLGWLESTILDAAERRPVAVFCHRSPFRCTSAAPAPRHEGWCREAPDHAAALLRSASVRLIVTGEGHAESAGCRDYRFEADDVACCPFAPASPQPEQCDHAAVAFEGGTARSLVVPFR